MATIRPKGTTQNTSTMNVLAPQQQAEGEQTSTSQPLTQSAQSSTIGTTGQAAAPKTQEKASGRFQNLKAILGANQGAGQGIAEAVKTNVAGQAQGGQTALNTSADKYKETLAANTQKAGQNYQAAQTALTAAPDQAAPTADQFASYLTVDQAQQEADKLAFDKQQAEAGLLQKKLADQAEAAKTEQGRQELIYNTFGKKGNYTTGMSKLDQLLLQGAGGTVQQDLAKNVADQAAAIEAAKKASLETVVDPAQKAYEAQMAKLTGTEEGSIRDIVAKQYSGIDEVIRNRMKGYQTEQQKLETDIEDFLTNPNSNVDVNAITSLSDQDKAALLKLKQEGTGARNEDLATFTAQLQNFGITDPNLIEQLYLDNQYQAGKIKENVKSSFNPNATSDAARFATQDERDRQFLLDNLLAKSGISGKSEVLESDLKQAAIDSTKQELANLGLSDIGIAGLPKLNLFRDKSPYSQITQKGAEDIAKSIGHPLTSGGGQLIVDLAKGDPSAKLDPGNINHVMGNTINADRGVSDKTRQDLSDAINNNDLTALQETVKNQANELTAQDTNKDFRQARVNELNEVYKKAVNLVNERIKNQTIQNFLQGKLGKVDSQNIPSKASPMVSTNIDNYLQDIVNKGTSPKTGPTSRSPGVKTGGRGRM